MTFAELATTLVLATSPVENAEFDKQALKAEIKNNLTIELQVTNPTPVAKQLVKTDAQSTLKDVSAE